MKSRVILISILLLLIISPLAYSRAPGKTFKEDNHLIYTIKSGDTLYALTRKFSITIDRVKKLYPNLNPKKLKIGTKLRFSISPELKTHTVKKDETLWQISKAYNFPLSQIIKLNDLPEPDQLFPGEIIFIPRQWKRVRSVLYFIKFTKTAVFLVPEERMIPVKHNFYTGVIEELIKGPQKDGHMPMTPETRVLSLSVNNGIAYLNFNNEIRRANVGSASEALLLNAIANSLTEFREIKAVSILINGRSGETIGGHIELSRPIERSEKLIRYQ